MEMAAGSLRDLIYKLRGRGGYACSSLNESHNASTIWGSKHKTAETPGSISVRCRFDARVSARCIIDVAPRVFAIRDNIGN